MATERKGYFATGRISLPGPDASAEMVVLRRFATEAEARAAGVSLVEAGIGAEVRNQPEVDAATADAGGPGTAGDGSAEGAPDGTPRLAGTESPAVIDEPWTVQVLRSDLDRAQEIFDHVSSGAAGGGGGPIDRGTADGDDAGAAPTGAAVRAGRDARRGAAATEPDDDRPPKLEKVPIPWLRVALIFLVALIVLPAAAFYFTFQIVGGGSCPSGRGVPVSEILNNPC